MHPLKILCAVMLGCTSPNTTRSIQHNPQPTEQQQQEQKKYDQPRVCERYEWQWNDTHVPKTEAIKQRDMKEWEKLKCPIG